MYDGIDAIGIDKQVRGSSVKLSYIGNTLFILLLFAAFLDPGLQHSIQINA